MHGQNPKIMRPIETLKSGFKDTLDVLVDLTEKEVKGAISFIWASSQCPNVDLKIEASIQIGRKKYWQGLSTTLPLPGHSLTKWLDVVLKDIISTLGGTAVVAGIISNITKFSGRPQVVRGLMGYIVDLTIVMQSLFWLTRTRAEAVSKDGVMFATVPLTKHLVELAFTAYATDEHSKTIHEDLRQLVKLTSVLKPDIVLDHIVWLIKSHRFHPSQSFATRAEAERETGEEDVNWETGLRA
ncbi:hypothetical protein B0H14DRAFT_2616611 [Mycena olivaceomarginata]|nr:hypothetical protein B0H14DRAFT_2616611 [Mycena olivaceomarginata]